jgi:hypothetical protein
MPFYASDFSDKRIQEEMDALRDLATARREFFRNIGQFNRRDQLTRMFLDSEVTFVQAVQARQVSPIHINLPNNNLIFLIKLQSKSFTPLHI